MVWSQTKSLIMDATGFFSLLTIFGEWRILFQPNLGWLWLLERLARFTFFPLPMMKLAIRPMDSGGFGGHILQLFHTIGQPSIHPSMISATLYFNNATRVCDPILSWQGYLSLQSTKTCFWTGFVIRRWSDGYSVIIDYTYTHIHTALFGRCRNSDVSGAALCPCHCFPEAFWGEERRRREGGGQQLTVSPMVKEEEQTHTQS